MHLLCATTLLLTLVLPLTTLANFHISDSIWFLPSGDVYSQNMACPSNYVRIFGSFSPFSGLPQAIQRLYTPKQSPYHLDQTLPLETFYNYEN